MYTCPKGRVLSGGPCGRSRYPAVSTGDVIGVESSRGAGASSGRRTGSWLWQAGVVTDVEISVGRLCFPFHLWEKSKGIYMLRQNHSDLMRW